MEDHVDPPLGSIPKLPESTPPAVVVNVPEIEMMNLRIAMGLRAACIIGAMEDSYLRVDLFCLLDFLDLECVMAVQWF